MDKPQHTYMGTLGKGRELKTVKIWCEREFGLKVPTELINNNQLYTHKEVWQLLDRYLYRREDNCSEHSPI